MPQIRSVRQVVEHRLCLGCGVCAYLCPKHIRMVDFAAEGLRPVFDSANVDAGGECLSACPAFENDHRDINRREGVLGELTKYCGPVLEIFEGFATDKEIRYGGASGGAITALALFCMVERGMHGTLHIGSDPTNPTRNCTKLSRSRNELLANTGSRYSAASACDRLDLIEKAPSACVFIGQPSEVTALRKAAKIRPNLSSKVGLTISFFCAGSPSRQGTLNLVKKMGLSATELDQVRYRGNGWPGSFTATPRSGDRNEKTLSYSESWGYLQAYRPLSTHLTPDGTGEDADISCGDPWYREIEASDPGQSLVVVRTELGREIVRAAMTARYLSLTPAEPWKLLKSQENLLAKRGAVGGRIATLRAMGLATPRLRGFSLFENWRRLTWSEKIRSTLGTVRRVIKRRYYRPLRLNPDCETSGRD